MSVYLFLMLLMHPVVVLNNSYNLKINSGCRPVVLENGGERP